MSQNLEIEIPWQLRPYLYGDGKFYTNDVWDELEGPPDVLASAPASLAPSVKNMKPDKYGAAAIV